MIGSELFEPVLVVSGAAKAVDRNASKAERPRRATGGDSIDGAFDLGHAIRGPGAGFAHDEGPVGGEERIDREEPERRRTIEDDEVVVDSLERHRKTVVGPDRVRQQL